MKTRLILALFLVVAIALGGIQVVASYAPPAAPIQPDKIESLVMDELTAAGQTDFFVWLTEQADLSLAYQLQTKEEKGRFVYETLRETAERSQKRLREFLDAHGVRYQSFYITNKILIQGGNQALLTALAARADVARVTANHVYQLEEPVEKLFAPASILAIEPNITFINADDAWALGYSGQNTVMAGNDTGLDETHPTIARHYRGCLNPPTCTSWDHNYNWWDATGAYPTNPYDGHGHGTHTTGTMVGDDGGTNQIGVAPGAQTVHCKNMTDGGSGTDAYFTTCFQWDLAPWDLSGANADPSKAPDAINNSWGYSGGNQNQFRDEIQALHAAGILVEVSAGNEGSSCATLRSPGDYWEVLTTGSVQHLNPYPGTITGFSSRGPSDLDPTPPYYFPDVMAPGEGIRSALPGNTYGSWSGTSMAGPHATALVGLCWSAAPSLRGEVAQTIQIFQDTAVPLTGQGGSNCGGDYTNGPNNDWGHGTIDALAAVQACLAAATPDFTIKVVPDSHDVCKPSVVTSDVQIGSIAGYNEAVTLSDIGKPAGVNTSFAPNPVYPLPGNSTYTIDVTASAADGSYSWTVRGTSATYVHDDTIDLVVNGAAPGSPSLISPANGALDVPPGNINFQWTAVSGASTYHLQVDDDPAFGSPAANVTGIETNSYTLAGPLNPTTTYYWRVSGVNGCGEGAFSGSFSFTTQALCILLVDDDNNAPETRTYFANALTSLGYAYDVFDAGTGTGNGPTAAQMSPYPIVIWFSGDKYGSSAGPNATDSTNLTTYLNGGGRLFLSSQDYLYDFGLTSFGQNYLGIGSYSNDIGDATSKVGVAGDPIGGGLGPYSLLYPSGFTDYGDIVSPGAGASLAFESATGIDLDVDKDGGTWKTVFFGTDWVPIYNSSAANGQQVLNRIITWFGGCGGTPPPTPTPTVEPPSPTPTPTPTNTPTPTPTFTPTPPPSVMHVDNIQLSYVQVRTKYTVSANITIKDQNTNPVSGATVSARWTIPGNKTADQQQVTGANGVATFSVTNKAGVYQICVTNVTKTGYTYDPNQNVETCDSITVP